MRYEKKMLILSGKGKGVVLIEKSGLGVRFALRTFGLAPRSGRKAGVVTRTGVCVRDLPDTPDPSAVFYIDDADIDTVHFAVFDSEIILYGAFGKKMWESNLMDLFIKHDRTAPPPQPILRSLPPIAERPKTLPLPDGTGIPQSRLAVYGDDALAESDFYSSLDLSERMRTVDSFLDTKRILDGLSPTVAPSPPSQLANPSVPINRPVLEVAATQYARNPEPSRAEQIQPQPQPSNDETEQTVESSSSAEPEQETEVASDVETEQETEVANEVETEQQTEVANEVETEQQTEVANEVETEQETEVASEVEAEQETEVASDCDEERIPETANSEEAEQSVKVEDDGRVQMPWEYEARYLAKLSNRVMIEPQKKIESIKPSENIKHLRESDFFERCRDDIEKLFSIAERDETLQSLLSDFEWVKVEFDGGAVSVGRASSCLCYAVDGYYEKTPPFGEETQWLPLRREAPTGKGYWLVFQNLATGKIIKAC